MKIDLISTSWKHLNADRITLLTLRSFSLDYILAGLGMALKKKKTQKYEYDYQATEQKIFKLLYTLHSKLKKASH